MNTAIKTIFTAFVIFLIVAPLPPSTIIGLGLVANPKTNKYLDHRAINTMNIALGVLKATIVWKVQVIGKMQENQLQRVTRL